MDVDDNIVIDEGWTGLDGKKLNQNDIDQEDDVEMVNKN
jgi:hypothetical protein